MDGGGQPKHVHYFFKVKLFKEVIHTLFLFSILLLNISPFYYEINSNMKSASTTLLKLHALKFP